MSSPSSPSNFVVRRKRKRHAIDPCLGYYHVQPPDPDPKMFCDAQISVPENFPEPSSESLELPPIAVLQEPMTSSDGEQFDLQSPSNTVEPVTVEAFLRAAPRNGQEKAGRKHARKYTHPAGVSTSRCMDEEPDNPRPPKHRYNRTCPSSPSSTEGTPVDQLFDDEAPSNASVKPKRKPLAQRLLQAAIASDANPVDSLVNDASRSPNQIRSLTLIPTKTESKTPGRRRLWTLTDPRKPVQITRDTSFITQHDTTMERKPLTRWPTRCQTSGVQKSLKRKGKRNGVVRASETKNLTICKPLPFVPLHEAESSYAARRGPPKKASKETPNQPAKPPPLIMALVDILSTTQVKKPVTVVTPKPLSPRFSDLSLPTLQNYASRNEPVEKPDVNFSTNASEVVLRPHSPELLESALPLPLLMSAQPSIPTNDLQSLPASEEPSTTVPDKKLPKPLSSFLDQFFETAKHAQSFSHSPPRPRNATHPKRQTRVRRPTPPLDDTVSHTTPEESNFADVIFMHDDDRDLYPLVERLPSPDLMEALKPSQYQIHLSSSPVEVPRRPVSVRRSMAGLRAFYNS
ncbi:hypothetical protein VNI00_005014 [Paramarasmius palmivorus]|uniref:Uncharacterized protein n=1 Tax=Paramarasmius palmivorus TaxID=297713 RepID=A0AAW0DI93_9AGAR